MRRIGLGQEAAPSTNRLDPLRLHVIRDRGFLVGAANVEGRLPQDPAVVRQKTASLDIDISSWTDDDIAALVAINNAPTPEEISDLSLVDSIFDIDQRAVAGKSSSEETADRLLALACGADVWRRDDPSDVIRNVFGRSVRGVEWLERGFGAMRVREAPLAGNPFFCTPLGPLQPPRNFYFTARQSFADFFKIGAKEIWGDVKRVVANIRTLLGTLEGYPFPSPISAMPGVWYQYAQDNLAEIIRNEGTLTPEIARTAVTLAVLEHYDAASQRIVHLLKKKEKKKRRRNLIKNIALGVLSLVSLVALPAAISSGWGAVTGILEAREARDAAKDLAKASKQFAESDAAFSAELERVAAELDAQAAQEEAAAAPTEEEAEAAAEEGYEAEIPPGTLEPAPDLAAGPGLQELLIGGGVAAAAVGLLAILR